MIMQVKVDKDKCIGCGTCASICPDCFIMTDHLAVVNPDCDCQSNMEKINQAKDACPVAAITVE